VTRSVRDSAALLDATCGPPMHMPFSLPRPQVPFLDAVGRDPGRLRIAWNARTPDGVALHPECRAAVERAAALAVELGHEVEEAAPEIDYGLLRRAMIGIASANIAEALAPGNLLAPEGAGRDDVETQTWLFAERGARMSASQYLRALRGVRSIGDRLHAFLQRYDLVLTPTMAQPPIRLGEIDPMADDFDGFNAAVQPYVSFTQMFNMSGQPAASLPLHWTAEGLPVGVQLAAPLGEEARLFAVAAQFEQACPWFDRRPRR